MCFWIQYIQIATMAIIFITFLFGSGNTDYSYFLSFSRCVKCNIIWECICYGCLDVKWALLPSDCALWAIKSVCYQTDMVEKMFQKYNIMIHLISLEIVWLLFSLWQNMVCHFEEPNLWLHKMADRVALVVFAVTTGWTTVISRLYL